MNGPSLKLGSLTLESNLIQAPLASISCAPFRLLTQKYGAPGYTCTEMLSSQHLLTGVNAPRYIYRSPEENSLCFQLSGRSSEVLAMATEKAIELGADIIDLNCGCPMPKIRKKQAGSKLLETPEHLHEILKAIRAITDKPLTCKIRLSSTPHLEVLEAVESAGVDALIVHGRTWQDDYSVPVYLEEIADIKSHATIPIIANGDVFDGPSAKKILDSTKADGLMIGRYGVGQPWIFAEIRAHLNNQPFTRPSEASQRRLFLEHLNSLSDLIGWHQALNQSKRFGQYYFRDYDRKAFHEFICQQNPKKVDFDQLKQLLDRTPFEVNDASK